MMSISTMAKVELLKVERLSKRFGTHWLFQDLSFSLHSGECLILEGHNGSGKSTLLRILAGLESPTQGSVGTNWQNPRVDVSYCGLDQAVFPNLSVREHLRLFAEIRGLEVKLDDILAKTGLIDHADHLSTQLSTGLRSRLKIAIAIQSQPRLLIWDEPGVALDEMGKKLIESIVRDQLQRGALVLATNDPAERRFGTHLLNLSGEGQS